MAPIVTVLPTKTLAGLYEMCKVKRPTNAKLWGQPMSTIGRELDARQRAAQ